MSSVLAAGLALAAPTAAPAAGPDPAEVGPGRTPFWIANTVRVTGHARLLAQILTVPEVAQVTADRAYQLRQPAPGREQAQVDGVEWGVDRINAPRVWDELGATGEGILVGSIDSGARFDHPALVRQYQGNLGDGRFDHNYHWHDPSRVCGDPSLAPV